MWETSAASGRRFPRVIARENRILSRIPETVSGADATDAGSAYFNYFQERRAEVNRFVDDEYPSVASSEVFVDTLKPKDLNQTLDDVIGATMGEYGFDLKRRKQSKSRWMCRSELPAIAVQIECGKGPWKMSVSVHMPGLLYFADVGAPFFFAQDEFPYRSSNIRHDLETFFVEYAKIFPHVIEAIERAIPIRNAYLAGGFAPALELARAAAPKSFCHAQKELPA